MDDLSPEQLLDHHRRTGEPLSEEEVEELVEATSTGNGGRSLLRTAKRTRQERVPSKGWDPLAFPPDTPPGTRK
jgi:hypothetical protein